MWEIEEKHEYSQSGYPTFGFEPETFWIRNSTEALSTSALQLYWKTRGNKNENLKQLLELHSQFRFLRVNSSLACPRKWQGIML